MAKVNKKKALIFREGKTKGHGKEVLKPKKTFSLTSNFYMLGHIQTNNWSDRCQTFVCKRSIMAKAF